MKFKYFQELHNYIEKKKLELQQEDAVAILINCCHICKANNAENNIEYYLTNILKSSNNSMNSLNEQQLLYYVQAIFHIVKYLLEMDFLQVIIETEKIIWPSFLPSMLSPKIMDIYLNLCKLIWNVLAKCVRESRTQCTKVLLRISEISGMICSKVSNPLQYLTLSANSLINLSKLGVMPEQQKKYYIFIVKQLELRVITLNIEELFEPLLTFSTVIVYHGLKLCNISTAEKYFREIENMSYKIFGRHTCICNLFYLLQFPFMLLSCNEKSEYLEKYSDILEAFANSEVKYYSQVLGKKLGMMLTTVVKFFESEGMNIWEKKSEKLQLEIYNCIYKISELECQKSIECTCGCSVRLNSYEIINAFQNIKILLDIALGSSSKLTLFYHETIISKFIKCIDTISFLKKNNCNNWKNAWNIFGSGVYNLAVHLYKKPDINGLHYFKFFIRYYIQFEEEQEVIKNSILSASIRAVCHLTANDHEKCLAFCALGIYMCPDQRDYFISLWIKIKHELKSVNDEIQTLSLVEAFNKFSDQLRAVVNSVNFLNEENQIKLLTFELEQYKRKWMSKKPMLATFKELHKRIKNLEKTTEIIGDTFSDSLLLFNENILEIANDVLTKFEQSHKDREDLHMSILYFLRYKYYMKKAMKRQAEEMEKNSKVVPIKTTNDLHKDSNEAFDIASKYENLNCETFLKNIKYLKLSLHHIENNFKDIVEKSDTFVIYNILMKIAFEYKLIYNRIETIRALNLALKIAKARNNHIDIVYCVSLLIEYADVKKDYVIQLIRSADELISTIDSNRKTNKIILTYYICKAKAFLHEDPIESYNNYTIASKMFDADNGRGNYLDIRNHLLFLKLKYVDIPCNIFGEMHNINPYDVISSIPIFYDDIDQLTDDAYEMAVILDTNEEITRFYHNKKCPQDVRYYCREFALLTQQILQPLRSASYLLHLSQADMYTQRMDDCRVKLNDVNDILSLNKHCVPMIKIASEKIDTDLEVITRELKNICFDLPNENLTSKKASPSSPIFPRETFGLPAFVKHLTTCDCFCCNCFEYRDLVLKKIHLEAMLNFKESNMEDAKHKFNYALNLYQLYTQRFDSYIKNWSSTLPHDIIPDLSNEYAYSYGSLLLNFTKFLMNVNKKSAATTINEKLITMLIPRKYACIHLYNEALLQKIGVITDPPSPECVILSPPVEATFEVIKTPEMKHNEVVVACQRLSPCSPIVKRKMKTRLAFETSPENNVCKNGSTRKVNKRQTTTSREDGREESNAQVKPARFRIHAPPKIKIYTEEETEVATTSGSVRKTRKKNVKKS